MTDDTIQELVENAEAGFPATSFKSVGRPRTVGIAAIHSRARREHTNTSEILRRALDEYLAS